MLKYIELNIVRITEKKYDGHDFHLFYLRKKQKSTQPQNNVLPATSRVGAVSKGTGQILMASCMMQDA